MTLKPLSQTWILWCAFAASALSLGAAYFSEFYYGLKPCHLCLAQRVPFALVIVLSLIGLLKQRWGRGLIVAIGLAFFINCGIASYHTAVENHWVPGPTGCTLGDMPANQSDDDFLRRIQGAPIVSCDQPQWELFGITMASMNAVWCLFLAIATFVALQYSGSKQAFHA